MDEEPRDPPVAVVLPYSIGARRKFRRRQRKWQEQEQQRAASPHENERPELCAEFAARRLASGWPAPCGLPAAFLQEVVTAYDPNVHPIVSILASTLGTTVALLPDLHKTAEVAQWLARPKLTNLGLNPVDRRFKAAGGFRQNPALRACYLRLLQEVVVPQLPDPDGWLYQLEPNLRCHLPGTGRQLVLRHCDADYLHQPHELNFWLPCTPAFGTNTLWVESAPGRADYRPMELRVGELLRFYGHQCDHYSVPNESGATRLSLDFRVVPRSHFLERYPGSHMRDGSARFGCPGFFAVLPGPETACACSSRSSSSMPMQVDMDGVEPSGGCADQGRRSPRPSDEGAEEVPLV